MAREKNVDLSVMRNANKTASVKKKKLNENNKEHENNNKAVSEMKSVKDSMQWLLYDNNNIYNSKSVTKHNESNNNKDNISTTIW